MLTRRLLKPSTPHGRLTSRLAWLMLGALAFWALLGGGTGLVGAFHGGTYNPGQRGQPTDGHRSDLGSFDLADATFTFQKNAVLTCTQNDTATSFTFHLDYDIDGTLPAGSVLVVYLSPNNGAVTGNGGSTESSQDAYIDSVEANHTHVDVSGLSGTGTIDINLTITSPFQLTSGGVLGVIAWDTDGDIVSNSKTNSLNCSEQATPTPPPTTPPPTTPPPTTPPPTTPPPTTPPPTPTPTGTEIVATPTPTPVPTTPAPTTPAPTTPAPTTPAPTTPAPTTPAPTTPAPTPTPSETVLEETPTPTATPSETVAGETPTPTEETTPPPTSTEDQSGGPGGTFLLVLLMLGLGTTGLLVLQPARIRSRRR